MNDRDTDTFVWKDGSTTDSYGYTNWIPFEPNGQSNENCVVMWVSSGNSNNGKWNDYSCSNSNLFPFVCGMSLYYIFAYCTLST